MMLRGCAYQECSCSSQPSSILSDPTYGPVELGMMSFLP
jgi:hypothetical protein